MRTAGELLHERIPMPLIQRQLGQHAYFSTTGTYLEESPSEEIIGAIHGRKAPMMHPSAGLELGDESVTLRGPQVRAGVAISGVRARQHKPRRDEGALYYLRPVLVRPLVDEDILCALIIALAQYSIDLRNAQPVVTGPRLGAS
jgi:hypothetical protein